MREYLLYPGCSMEHSARAYEMSLAAVSDALGIHLNPIEDWNCCGATEYLGISSTPAYSLIARNLAIASRASELSQDLVAPCSACYLNLSKADHHMQAQPDLERRVNLALDAGGLHYQPGNLRIRHILDVIFNDIGASAVERHVVQPLAGLRLAPYLGCMVPRPDYAHRFSDYDVPTELDELLRALGAAVVDFPLRTECCGGHMPQIGPDMGFELIRRLISAADELGADALVTLCPMCQLNLDAYQAEVNQKFKTGYHMPVLFFTQAMGLAFGVEPKELGFGLELVSARNVLDALGVPAPDDAPQAPSKRPRRPEGLPMPRPLAKHVPADLGVKEEVR